MYATLKIFTYFLKPFKIHPNHTRKKQIFQCRGLVYLGYTLNIHEIVFVINKIHRNTKQQSISKFNKVIDCCFVLNSLHT